MVGVGAGAGLHLALRSDGAAGAPALPALHGQASWPAGKLRAPRFTLRDQTGRLVSLAALRGPTVVVAFMDPLCKQECPIEGRGISLAERQVAPAKRPTVLIVSVNPTARPADAVKATHKWGITGNWHWLLGTHAQLAPGNAGAVASGPLTTAHELRRDPAFRQSTCTRQLRGTVTSSSPRP